MMCAIDDGERYTVYSRRNARAKADYSCDECGRTIERGEVYSYAAGLYDGHWDTHRTCAHCAVGQDWILLNCGGFLHLGLFDEIREHAEEYPVIADAIEPITAGMQSRWRTADGRLVPLPDSPPDIRRFVEGRR